MWTLRKGVTDCDALAGHRRARPRPSRRCRKVVDGGTSVDHRKRGFFRWNPVTGPIRSRSNWGNVRHRSCESSHNPAVPESLMCQHLTACPSADAVDREAARIVATFQEQGWSLLCNGVIIFDDTGEILPDGTM